MDRDTAVREGTGRDGDPGHWDAAMAFAPRDPGDGHASNEARRRFGVCGFWLSGEGHAPATADDVLLFPSSSAPEARTATGAARPRLRCEAGLAALPARREATFVRLARDSILEGPCDQCGDAAHRSRGKILPSRICIGLITRRLIS